MAFHWDTVQGLERVVADFKSVISRLIYDNDFELESSPLMAVMAPRFRDQKCHQLTLSRQQYVMPCPSMV